ncbi:MAG: glycosyltransferase family 2 protein [Eubacteriales bacterium]
MFRALVVSTALLIAIYCLTIFIRQIVVCKTTEYSECLPVLSLLFLVKNQQDIIEGLVRSAFTEARVPVEVIAVDMGSADQTGIILELLSGHFQSFSYLLSGDEQEILNKVYDLCRGNTIYCFDLTTPVNYNLISRTINSIFNGSKVNLYRTKVLYMKKDSGRHHQRCNVV